MKDRVLNIMLFVVSVLVSALLVLTTWNAWKRAVDRQTQCEAAQQTIIEETDLITESGHFPSQEITDRWKALLKGC